MEKTLTEIAEIVGGELVGDGDLKIKGVNSLSEAKEGAQPAEIKVISILTSDCEECYDITSDLNALKNRNVKILEERSYEFDSEEAELVIDNWRPVKLHQGVYLNGEVEFK